MVNICNRTLGLYSRNTHSLKFEVSHCTRSVLCQSLVNSQRNLAANGVKNACVVTGDAYASVDGKFSAILLNPPIRAGKQVIYGMFDESFNRLTPGGTLTIVIRKQQGAPSAKKYLEELFGNCETIAKSGGYWILRCRKEKSE